MAPTMDYNALRAQTLQSGNDEEAVTVNTRALIDKVLARYSGEWTVLRELLQNAADASANKVTIRFESSPSLTTAAPTSTDESEILKHTLQHHTLNRLVVTNNGQAFAATDWSRLKRIAEGNPDETKIGAFGVGFYSVFADCEEPFVSSGTEAMAFYWKGNSLFTRRVSLAEAQSETSFVLDYRSKSSPVPQLLPLCQFLATSLTFVGLQAIDLWLDDRNILKLSKKAAPSVSVTLPKTINLRTQEELMTIATVDRETVQIDATWMEIVRWTPPPSFSRLFESGGGDSRGHPNSAPSLRGFFSRLTGNNSSTLSLRDQKPVPEAIPDNLSRTSTATVFLRITTGNVRTSVGSTFAREIERATKKKPPQMMKVAILSGALPVAKRTEIFSSVLPSKSGKVFIGFPTQQTTGIAGLHLSAPSVIPTVEREAIDLNARYVRTWNMEVLRAAGIVCRVAWASEMSEIKKTLDAATSGKKLPEREEVEAALPEAIHVFKQFTFGESTPSYQVGQIVEQAFWTSNTQPSIELLSTRGILPSQDVRIASEDLSGFVQGIPVLPDRVIEGAPQFVSKLREYGLVSEIKIADVQKELEAKALDGKQLCEFLKWAARQASQREAAMSSIRALLDAAVVSVDHRVIILADITAFVNPSKIPSDVPVPPTTLPFEYTKALTKAELESLGWEELQIVPWTRYLVEQSGSLGPDKDLASSAAFAGQVLAVVSKQWESLSTSSKGTIVSLLQDRTIIPTKLGMMKPTVAYFPTVKLFQDLPIVSGLQGVKDKVLLGLGVRKTVELSVVFDRLMSDPQADAKSSAKPDGRWSHVDLIRYLASVQSDIPSDDIKRLKDTPICPAEEAQDPTIATTRRYKVNELYEPSKALRSLELPIIHWPGIYRSGSAEGRFLSALGIRSMPGVPDLISIMATAPKAGNLALRDQAMKYFIEHHHINGYVKFGGLSDYPLAYLPLQGEEPTQLSTARACFTHERAALVGFPILRRDLHAHATKFGVMSDPPMVECAQRLQQKPPKSRGEATLLFAYFASRLNEISPRLAEQLGGAALVPIAARPQQRNSAVGDESSSPARVVSPRKCFLGDNAELEDVFDYVDFGHEANAFLLKCGSKHEPTKVQLATLLVQEPARLLSALQSTEKYLSVLRSLAQELPMLKKDKALYKEMKRAPFLLAYKEISVQPSKPKSEKAPVSDARFQDVEEEEEAGIKEWSLASAGQIILVDDIIGYNTFRESLKAAPQEELLEDFYYNLGSPLVSSIIEEEPRITSVVADQSGAMRLRRLVLERSRLFLHDYASDAVRHDTRWLEKKLGVQAVKSISLRRTLRGHQLSHTETRSAALTQDQRQGWTLWITAGGCDLFQVSQALVSILLNRPKPHSAMMLEMLFSTDLMRLRTRGYNVDRILRAKAAEARIAEDKRQKQVEEEQKAIREQEEAWNKQQSQQPPVKQPPHDEHNVPGAFHDSPEEPTRSMNGDAHRSQKPRGLFSSITKRLGLDEGAQSSRQMQNLLNGGATGSDQSQAPRLPQPPPYAEKDPKATQKPDPVTAPFQVRQNLASAINASRAYDSSDLYSRPETRDVKDTGAYCDEKPGHDISFVADAQHGIRIFLANSLADKTRFLQVHLVGLNLFAGLLAECSNVFNLRSGTVNIFFDESGSTIAFNRQGSLFCNYRFFQQLHLDGLAQRGAAKPRGEALVYWWVVLCHELAHNLVESHSAEHSYWTENFVAQYFGDVVLQIARYNATSAGAARTVPPATEPRASASLLD